MSIREKVISDESIIKQVLNGNINVFEELITRYQGYVLSIVAKHSPAEKAEEIAQEVFIRAYKSLNKIKKAGSFKSWLSAIAVRSCYDYWRKHYRSREILISELSSKQKDWFDRAISDRSEETWEKEDRQKEAKQVLDWLLTRLNAAERIVIELVYIEGFSIEETSKLLGWSSAKVKVRAFRARQKLQRLIKGKGNKDGLQKPQS
jgi:RNA polymerase sigma-70 factor (ECF subfamily)